MFKNNYQGGAVVEVFSGQGKDPVAKWKLCGGPSAIYKEYNKEVKGFVYCLEGSSQTVKMQMPECVKMPLGLVQRFLVLQVNIPQCKDFSVELVITDSEHLKRRLHLSTVHKELSATPLHAKIPFVALNRNVWSTLCLDLLSFAAQLFKGFLTLDGITLFATCKVRRIFTMKTEPTGMSDDDMFLRGAGVMDLIPRSCQFPPDVHHVTQMLSMESLQKAEMSAGPVKSDSVRDHSGTARPTSYRQTRPQGVMQSAPGSRASGPRPLNGRKSSVATDGTDRNALIISNKGSTFSRRNQRVSTESQIISKLRENSPHGEPSLALNGGTPGRLQPHPPADKQGSRKPRVLSAGRERLESSDAAAPGHHRERSKTRERRTPPSSGREVRQEPLIQTEQTKHLTADEVIAAEESSRATPDPAECLPCTIRPGLSSDLQVWSSWENNEGSEPQLSLQEEVFIFSSQPHSPKGGQGQGDQEKIEMGDEKDQKRSGRRHEAQPEDDFIGSESDEEKSFTTFQQQRTDTESNPAIPRAPDPTLYVHVQDHSKSSHKMDQASAKELHPATTNTHTEPPSRGRSELAGMAPTRCLSPGATLECKCGPCGSEVMDQSLAVKSSVTLSRKLLQEATLADSPQHKEEENEKLEPVDSSHYNIHLLGSHRMHGDDDEELQMLASLKREQEEDECRASGLRVSQIHQCNVSISMSSDDASTWTHISMRNYAGSAPLTQCPSSRLGDIMTQTHPPATQGHHYQNEINPLLHSNPREWMDVLSPPIMAPSQQRRSGNTCSNKEHQVAGVDESVNEEEAQEDEYLNLLYDPCLNCYFDPKTGKYYELA